MKSLSHLLCCTSLIGLLAGCATRAYISSEIDPRYTISKTDPIHVPTLNRSTIAERTITRLVEEEMRKSGFNVVSKEEAQYVLFVSLGEKTSQISGSMPMTQTATTSGSVGTTPYSGSTTYTTHAPYSYNYRVKKLYATLVAMQDMLQDKTISVWEGYVGAEHRDFDRYARPMIREMLSHFGNNYGADIRIDCTTNDPETKPIEISPNEKNLIEDVENAIEDVKNEMEESLIEDARTGDVEAQYNLGVSYYHGYYIRQDYKEAVKWYRLAAEKGAVRAQTNLGACYDKGNGVPEDQKEAVKWYRLAAEQGHATAQNNLGFCYSEGNGVPEDQKEAVKWYRLAAEQGYASAQNNLAACYDQGTGVLQDYVESYAWALHAAMNGDAQAKELLASRLTPEQIARGQERAKELQKLIKTP